MEYIITIGDNIASCTCGMFKINLHRHKDPKKKILDHAEYHHDKEPLATVITRNAWWNI